jgi:phage shock protein E
MSGAMRRLVVLFVLGACSKSEPAQAPPAPASTSAAPAAKDPATARKLIAEGAVVLDVRSPEEFAEAHLPSAVNIPVDDVTARVAEIDKLVGGDKSRPVVVYCAAGSRARKAKQQLDATGYSHVVNGGGLDDLR